MQIDNKYAQLRDWIMRCPSLNSDAHVRIDYTSERPTEYSIYAVPSTIAYRENVLGEMVPADIQEINFTFASKEYWGADERQNLENHTFYQDVISWLIEQNANRNFPQIPEGQVRSIVPTLSPYVTRVDENTAVYQIQIKMKYKRY